MTLGSFAQLHRDGYATPTPRGDFLSSGCAPSGLRAAAMPTSRTSARAQALGRVLPTVVMKMHACSLACGKATYRDARGQCFSITYRERVAAVSQLIIAKLQPPTYIGGHREMSHDARRVSPSAHRAGPCIHRMAARWLKSSHCCAATPATRPDDTSVFFFRLTTRISRAQDGLHPARSPWPIGLPPHNSITRLLWRALAFKFTRHVCARAAGVRRRSGARSKDRGIRGAAVGPAVSMIRQARWVLHVEDHRKTIGAAYDGHAPGRPGCLDASRRVPARVCAVAAPCCRCLHVLVCVLRRTYVSPVLGELALRLTKRSRMGAAHLHELWATPISYHRCSARSCLLRAPIAATDASRFIRHTGFLGICPFFTVDWSAGNRCIHPGRPGTHHRYFTSRRR